MFFVALGFVVGLVCLASSLYMFSIDWTLIGLIAFILAVLFEWVAFSELFKGIKRYFKEETDQIRSMINKETIDILEEIPSEAPQVQMDPEMLDKLVKELIEDYLIQKKIRGVPKDNV